MSRAFPKEVLGIDLGTSGARAAIVSHTGDILATASAPFTSLGTDPSSPETWWRALTDCVAALKASHGLDKVSAVAVDGTSGTVVAVDKDGIPVGPARMYNEPCTDQSILARIDTAAPAESAARGSTSGLARVLMMQDRPGVRRLLHQADWLAGMLAGRFDVSDANNALKTGYDPISRQWPTWIARTGAAVEKLPNVLEPGEPIGPVGPASISLGLPASALVHAGTTDGCASFLATGAALPGEAVTALGSTLVIKLLSDQPIFAPAYGIYSHRIGVNWLAGGASNSGGKVIADLFPGADLRALTALIRPSQPTGLDYYPLSQPGERFPISDSALPPRLSPRPDSEAVFFQGILEGIAGIEFLAYRRLADLGAPRLLSVRSVGGGAANAAWTKIRQSRLGVPFEPAFSQDACVGTARLILSSQKNTPQ